MRSKLPDAEKFQDWVVDVVFPQIRKTGMYAIAPVTVEKLLADPDLLIQLATGLKAERAKRLAAMEDQRKKIEATTCNDMQHLGWKLQERCGSMARQQRLKCSAPPALVPP